MQILLTQNVPNLGALGDRVNVKDGYARNYLLPRGMAIAAGSKNARQIEHQRKRLEKLRQEAVAAAKGEAEKVAAIEIVVKAKTGPGGKLFGSVSSRDLAAAFAEKGIELDRKAFVLHAPAKHTGTFGATVRLHTDVKVDIVFKVEASGTVEAPPAEAPAAESAPAGAAAAEGAGPAAKAAEQPAQDVPAAPTAPAEPKQA